MQALLNGLAMVCRKFSIICQSTPPLDTSKADSCHGRLSSVGSAISFVLCCMYRESTVLFALPGLQLKDRAMAELVSDLILLLGTTIPIHADSFSAGPRKLARSGAALAVVASP